MTARLLLELYLYVNQWRRSALAAILTAMSDCPSAPAEDDHIAEPVAHGPALWENCRHAADGAPCRESVEGSLYSDADFAGEIIDGLGPLQIVNTSARHGERKALFRAAALLDLHWLPILDGRVRLKTEAAAHHGGSDLDEVAAVLSLALGVRCRSGGMTRSTGLDHHERTGGRPIEWAHVLPYLPPPGRLGPLLPSLPSAVRIEAAKPVFEALFHADRESAVALMRSARLYQQALWVADDDPNQAWLQLVAALETAANRWTGKDPRPKIERLEDAWPELGAVVGALPDPARSELATLLVALVRSKGKLLRFVHKFAPPRPTTDLPEWALIDWSDLEPLISQVYDYRSRSLHAGTPFPSPMLLPPEVEGETPAQRPSGLSMGVGAQTWAIDDLPVYLDTFAGIARDMLLAWTENLAVSE